MTLELTGYERLIFIEIYSLDLKFGVGRGKRRAGESDRRGVSEWRKIWANGLPNEGRSPKSGHRMATEGMQFP